MEPFKRGQRVSIQTSRALPGSLHNIRVQSQRQINASNESDSDSLPPTPTARHTISGRMRKGASLLIKTRRILRAKTAPELEAPGPELHPSHRTMMKAHLREQIVDDLFVGIDRRKKVVPQCRIPSNDSDNNNVSLEEKVDCVVSDPKFGMFSFFYYHMKTGRLNEQLTERNVVYCSHVFSFWSALPLLIFASQWVMYSALILYIYNNTDSRICPDEAPLDQKLLLFGISILYYVKSFGMWDNLADRSRRKRMIPSNSYIVILDSLQEYGFNLLVYLANLWIVYKEHDLINMLLDSLALEYLMILDNQFKEMYFSYLPLAASDIFDNEFVTYSQNRELIREKEKNSRMFYCFRRLTWVPFKLLQLGLILFPPLCLAVGIYGLRCK
jgi:hypothetical protein